MTDDGWQPMDTAPRDGTEILCCAKDPHLSCRWYRAVARWSDDDSMPGTVQGWFWPFAIRPSHWRPLPAPPDTGG